MSQRGSTTLPAESFARGYRDGFSDHAPRSKADEYLRGFRDGHRDRDYTAQWMTRPRNESTGTKPSENSRLRFNRLITP